MNLPCPVVPRCILRLILLSLEVQLLVVEGGLVDLAELLKGSRLIDASLAV